MKDATDPRVRARAGHRGGPAARIAKGAAALTAVSIAAALTIRAAGAGDADAGRHIENARPAGVMVMAIDVRGGELVPISSGSGTIVSPEGAVLTNYHVLSDTAEDRLHDLFAVAVLRGPGQPLEIACAGAPERGRHAPRVDLALIQCEMDLDGLPDKPKNWPVASIGDSESITPGQRLWILGYPDASGLTLRESFGQVLGWTGEGRSAGDAYIKTDAAITHGNSGGAAINARGDLIGIPSAYRIRRDEEGGTSAVVGSVGLIRPVEAASELLDTARSGWRPNDVERPTDRAEAAKDEAEAAEDEDDPRDASAREEEGAEADEGAEAAEGEAEGEEAARERAEREPSRSAGTKRGVVVASRVISARSGQPIAGAVVAILEPGTDPRAPGVLAEAVTWGETDAGGAFRLRAPLARRATYPVVVMADGYRAASDPEGLELASDAPQLHDPWGRIELRPARF